MAEHVRKRHLARSSIQAGSLINPDEAKRMKRSCDAELSESEVNVALKRNPDSDIDRYDLIRAKVSARLDTKCATRLGKTVTTLLTPTSEAEKLRKRGPSLDEDSLQCGLKGNAGQSSLIDILKSPIEVKRIKIKDNAELSGGKGGSVSESVPKTSIGDRIGYWDRNIRDSIAHSKSVSNAVTSLCDQMKNSVQEYVVNTLKTSTPYTYPSKITKLLKVLTKLAVVGKEISKLNEEPLNPLDCVKTLYILMHHLVRQAATNLTEDMVYRNINISALMEHYELYRVARLNLMRKSENARENLDLKFSLLRINVRKAMEYVKREIVFISKQKSSPFLKPTRADSGLQDPRLDSSCQDSKVSPTLEDPLEGCSWHYSNLECISQDSNLNPRLKDPLEGCSRQHSSEEHDRQHPKQERDPQNPKEKRDPQIPKQESEPHSKQERNPQNPEKESDPQHPKQECNSQDPKVLEENLRNDLWAQVLESVTETLQHVKNESKVPQSLDDSYYDHKVPQISFDGSVYEPKVPQSLSRSVNESEIPMELHNQPEGNECMTKTNTLQKKVKLILNKTDIPLISRGRIASSTGGITKIERQLAVIHLNESLWEIEYEVMDHFVTLEHDFKEIKLLYTDYIDFEFAKDRLLETFLKKVIPNLFKPN